MKDLTIKKKINDFQISFLEKKMGVVIPEDVKAFLQKYAETSVIEDIFTNKQGKKIQVASFCSNRMIHDFFKEILDNDFGKKLAFAVDPGGWPLCISFDVNNMGEVLLYQMELSVNKKAHAFEFVAQSFNDFIEGLQPENSK